MERLIEKKHPHQAGQARPDHLVAQTPHRTERSVRASVAGLDEGVGRDPGETVGAVVLHHLERRLLSLLLSMKEKNARTPGVEACTVIAYCANAFLYLPGQVQAGVAIGRREGSCGRREGSS